MKESTKKLPLIVVRGHVTGDIQGVTRVVGASTLPAYGLVANSLHGHDILVECDQITLDAAKAHVKDKRDKYYIGGTAHMWYVLRRQIKYTLDLDIETFIVKALPKPTIVGTDCSMIFERRYKNGTKVTALYGPSPALTEEAVKEWDYLPYLSRSYRLLISSKGKLLLRLEY